MGEGRQGVWNPTSSLSPRQDDTHHLDDLRLPLVLQAASQVLGTAFLLLLDTKGMEVCMGLGAEVALVSEAMRADRIPREEGQRATYPSSQLLLVLWGWRASEELSLCPWDHHPEACCSRKFLTIPEKWVPDQV